MNPYILLAKKAVENYIEEKRIILPLENLPKEFLNKKSGTFVTIKKKSQLRGCIGTYLATKENIAEEIIHNAIAAAIEDYRFGPIRKQELPSLSYTVYILSKPELVLTKEVLDPPKFFFKKFKQARLDPKKYGIIVKTVPISYPDSTDVVFNGHLPSKTGLLLPDLEGIDTVKKQIFLACQKGGIDPEREKIMIYKFSVEKYAQDE